MTDPMIMVRERRPIAAGFWVQDFAGGDLLHVDAHPEHNSSVTSIWPTMDRISAYGIEQAIDWILNAAAASRQRVEQAFRALYPGSRTETEVWPNEWWGRQFGGIAAIEFSAFFGNRVNTVADRSRAGLVIDDSTSEINVTGFLGGIQNPDPADRRERYGQGPGGGLYYRGGNDYSSRPGAGSHGTLGHPTSSLAGYLPEASWAIEALQTGVFNAENLAMGGGGGASRRTRDDQNGGNAGAGYVRISRSHITETQGRDVSAPTTTRGENVNLAGAGNRGGVGSGGGIYYITRRGVTIPSGITHDLRNGLDHATEGNGRLTTFSVDQPSVNGTVRGGVITYFQIYPSIPFGGVRVM
ncbi:MAG: hypothetical protein OXM62_04535 [bacterium]|nr:hypothetical protein [bacterium]MDE0234252.1 hypothetical protein [bacterium]